MGLLDSILGSVIANAGRQGGFPGASGGAGPANAGGLDLGAILGGLAGMAGGAPQQPQGGGLGGLGGVLGSVLGGGSPMGGAPSQAGGMGGMLGGALGAGLLQAILSMIMNNGRMGGLGGMQQRFQQQGLGDVMNSWIAPGQNMPISADQLQQVFGGQEINDLASRFGLSTGDLAGHMSQLLPEVVDRLTPQGQAPQGGFGGLEDMLGALLNQRR